MGLFDWLFPNGHKPHKPRSLNIEDNTEVEKENVDEREEE